MSEPKVNITFYVEGHRVDAEIVVDGRPVKRYISRSFRNPDSAIEAAEYLVAAGWTVHITVNGWMTGWEYPGRSDIEDDHDWTQPSEPLTREDFDKLAAAMDKAKKRMFGDA